MTDHTAIVHRIIENMDAPADELMWHYVHAAYQRYGTIIGTARALGMHRRTVQRLLKRQPKPRRSPFNVERMAA